MEYIVTGTITVKVTEIILTEILLAQDTMPAEARNQITHTSGDLLQDTLTEACGFDITDDHWNNGIRVIVARIAREWDDGCDAVLDWLAGCGAGMSGKFVTGNGYAWTHKSEIGSRESVARQD